MLVESLSQTLGQVVSVPSVAQLCPLLEDFPRHAVSVLGSLLYDDRLLDLIVGCSEGHSVQALLLGLADVAQLSLFFNNDLVVSKVRLNDVILKNLIFLLLTLGLFFR